jgi:hypothetical protein
MFLSEAQSGHARTIGSFDDHECYKWQGITFKVDNITMIELSQNKLQGRLDDLILVDVFAKLGSDPLYNS